MYNFSPRRGHHARPRPACLVFTVAYGHSCFTSASFQFASSALFLACGPSLCRRKVSPQPAPWSARKTATACWPTDPGKSPPPAACSEIPTARTRAAAPAKASPAARGQRWVGDAAELRLLGRCRPTNVTYRCGPIGHVGPPDLSHKPVSNLRLPHIHVRPGRGAEKSL